MVEDKKKYEARQRRFHDKMKKAGMVWVKIYVPGDKEEYVKKLAARLRKKVLAELE